MHFRKYLPVNKLINNFLRFILIKNLTIVIRKNKIIIFDYFSSFAKVELQKYIK